MVVLLTFSCQKDLYTMKLSQKKKEGRLSIEILRCFNMRVLSRISSWSVSSITSDITKTKSNNYFSYSLFNLKKIKWQTHRRIKRRLLFYKTNRADCS